MPCTAPPTLDIGATDDYVRFRRGEVAPVYNYGCYEATKNTFGIMVYQEQFMSVAHTLGGFDLGKTDLLRKAIGKKKADLMATLKRISLPEPSGTDARTMRRRKSGTR